MKHFKYSPTNSRYSLCTSKKQFNKLLNKFKFSKENRPVFVSYNADATIHFFDTDKGMYGVICLGNLNEYSQEEIYALILHECIHLWQMIKRNIQEELPGDEIEAYSIQSIFRNMLSEYKRKTK